MEARGVGWSLLTPCTNAPRATGTCQGEDLISPRYAWDADSSVSRNLGRNSFFHGCDYCLKVVTLFTLINNLNLKIKANFVQLKMPTIK